MAASKKSIGTLKITDSRTGKTYTVEIDGDGTGSIPALALRQIKVKEDDFGLMTLDTGYLNTACVRSSITYIDGERGILRYRGYDIDDLAEHSSFLEERVRRHTFLHENLLEMLRTFRYNAHPHAIYISSMAAMSTLGSDLYTRDMKTRNKQIFRILGKTPTIAAAAYRHRIGRAYNYPRANLGYVENFLYMLDALNDYSYEPNPVLVRTLEKLFICHADHELNCSTATARQVGSSLTDPFSVISAAGAALYGPLHGGANEAVIHMLQEIGSVDRVPQFIEKVKRREAKLMGFGHRVYRNFDPRARILKKAVTDLFQVTGRDSLMDVAEELERVALSDPYFIERKLYPNVDYFSGLAYRALGFPTDMFPLLFAIARTAGWLAHWVEGLSDPANKIWRPRQIYTGYDKRPYVPVADRKPSSPAEGAQAYTRSASSAVRVELRGASPATPAAGAAAAGGGK